MNILKYRFITLSASLVFVLIGLVFFLTLGFNTGLDFASGYSQVFQIAPVGFIATYSGEGSAELSVSQNILILTVKRANNINIISFDPSLDPKVSDIVEGLRENGVSAEIVNNLDTTKLVSGFGFPVVLSDNETRVNFSTVTQDTVIEDIRSALSSLKGVSVQTVGGKSEGIFKVRMPVGEESKQSEIEKEIKEALSLYFTPEEIITLSSDFVGPKFSSSLLKNSITAILIALLLILLYISVRFRVSYALSSILALFHDVLAMLSFVLIFRLEVSSTTIAALLTIIGYSLNNTVVIFDKVRENVKENMKEEVDINIEKAVKKSLSRTIITSFTTLLAVAPLAIFGSGDIKLFAINLSWGVIAGGYSSVFLAPSFLHFFNKILPINKEKKKEESDYLLV